jgi:hypothetical protein
MKPANHGNSRGAPQDFEIIQLTASQADQLAVFRRLTGIDSARRQDRELPLLPGFNQGIYQHAVENERNAQRKYTLFSSLINSCLGLQIVVAAALTALGAGDGPHAVVTIFGAINTVIAGLLTFLKGSGLPDRHKISKTEWSKVREFIEQRERDFSCDGCMWLVYEEVDKVVEMYNNVRAGADAGTPDGNPSGKRSTPRAGGLKTVVSGRKEEQETRG